MLGIGVVKDEYLFDENIEFAHQKPVDWKIIKPNLTNGQGNQTTVYKIDDPKVIESVNLLLEEENQRRIQK